MLDAEFYRKQCARLRKENEELFEEVINLREQCEAYAKITDTPEQRAVAVLGLPPSAARMLCRLLDAAPKTIAVECLLMHVNSRRGGEDTIKVYICRTRKALERLGIADPVQNIRGHGYRITEEKAHAMRMLFGIGAESENNEDPINTQAILSIQPDRQDKKRAVG